MNIKEIKGKIRLCFAELRQGKSWFSFVGEPNVSLEIQPLIGKHEYPV